MSNRPGQISHGGTYALRPSDQDYPASQFDIRRQQAQTERRIEIARQRYPNRDLNVRILDQYLLFYFYISIFKHQVIANITAYLNTHNNLARIYFSAKEIVDAAIEEAERTGEHVPNIGMRLIQRRLDDIPQGMHRNRFALPAGAGRMEHFNDQFGHMAQVNSIVLIPLFIFNPGLFP